MVPVDTVDYIIQGPPFILKLVSYVVFADHSLS